MKEQHLRIEGEKRVDTEPWAWMTSIHPQGSQCQSKARVTMCTFTLLLEWIAHFGYCCTHRHRHTETQSRQEPVDSWSNGQTLTYQKGTSAPLQWENFATCYILLCSSFNSKVNWQTQLNRLQQQLQGTRLRNCLLVEMKFAQLVHRKGARVRVSQGRKGLRRAKLNY